MCGYIAKSFKRKYPNLGEYTHVQDKNEFSTQSSTSPCTASVWISELSVGGLTIPSNQLVAWLNCAEKKFQLIHKKSISKEKNVTQKYVARVSFTCSGSP